MVNNDASENPTTGESFEEFRSSFAYSTRTDLFFKWLNHGPEKFAADFLQELLDLTGDLVDTGDTKPIIRAIVRAQEEAYSDLGKFKYDNRPFAELTQPVSQSRVALLTTTGHFATDDDPNPFGMTGLTQEQVVNMTGDFGKADPTLSEIPVSTSRLRTSVRHGGYDIRAAAADRNTSFPIDRMLELEDEGVIGQFVNPAFSFVGLTSQLRLRKQIAPSWAAKLKAAGAQAAVLIPI